MSYCSALDWIFEYCALGEYWESNWIESRMMWPKKCAKDRNFSFPIFLILPHSLEPLHMYSDKCRCELYLKDFTKTLGQWKIDTMANIALIRWQITIGICKGTVYQEYQKKSFRSEKKFYIYFYFIYLFFNFYLKFCCVTFLLNVLNNYKYHFLVFHIFWISKKSADIVKLFSYLKPAYHM